MEIVSVSVFSYTVLVQLFPTFKLLGVMKGNKILADYTYPWFIAQRGMAVAEREGPHTTRYGGTR